MIDFQNLAKIELHLHLDCTLSFKTLQELKPGSTYEDYVNNYRLPVKCATLEEYIDKTQRALPLMQTPESLKAVVDGLFMQLQEEKVLYVEIRFAPHLHLEMGMSPFQVVQTVDRAVKQGVRKFGIEARVILCTMREFPQSISMEVAELVKHFSDSYVAGMDIAGQETRHDIQNHVMAFRQVHESGIPCTAHAGESRGAESVWETLDNLHPQRLGHGIRSVEDESLLTHLRDNGIHLEVCPSSNVQTGLYSDIRDHQLMTLRAHEVSISISTDARSISGTTLASEYALLHEYFGWQKEDFLKANLEAVRHAFVDDETKKRLRERLIEAYGTS